MKKLNVLVASAVLAFGTLAVASPVQAAECKVGTQGACTVTTVMSRSQVEASYSQLQTAGTVCGYAIPFPASAFCHSGGESALAQAHYQKKRVKIVDYLCGYNYCSTTKYYVIS